MLCTVNHLVIVKAARVRPNRYVGSKVITWVLELRIIFMLQWRVGPHSNEAIFHFLVRIRDACRLALHLQVRNLQHHRHLTGNTSFVASPTAVAVTDDRKE